MRNLQTGSNDGNKYTFSKSTRDIPGLSELRNKMYKLLQILLADTSFGEIISSNTNGYCRFFVYDVCPTINIL